MLSQVNSCHSIQVDDLSISRYVQSKHFNGRALADIVSDPANARAFQELILEEMRNRITKLQQESRAQVLVFDRTFYDVAAYTVLWAKKNPAYFSNSDWVERYVENCFDHALHFFNQIFFFPLTDRIPFVEESGRASKEDQTEHNSLLELYLTSRHNSFVEVPFDTPIKRAAFVIDRL